MGGLARLHRPRCHNLGQLTNWPTGQLANWDDGTRLPFANDPWNLLAVGAEANVSTGDADAAG